MYSVRVSVYLYELSPSFVVNLFVFPRCLCPAAVRQPASATRGQIEPLDAVKVRKASEVTTDRQPARSLSTCQADASLYIHMTALVDVLGVAASSSPVAAAAVCCDRQRHRSHQRTLLDFDLDFAGNVFRNSTSICRDFAVELGIVGVFGA